MLPPKVARPPSAARVASELQLVLPWVPAPTVEEAELDAIGIAPAAWPWVLAARAEARRLGRVPVPGCDGCEWFGCCALHAPTPDYVPPTPRVGPPAPPRDLATLPPPGRPSPDAGRLAARGVARAAKS